MSAMTMGFSSVPSTASDWGVGIGVETAGWLGIGKEAVSVGDPAASLRAGAVGRLQAVRIKTRRGRRRSLVMENKSIQSRARNISPYFLDRFKLGRVTSLPSAIP
jgi:hypothetical protein